MEVNEVVKKRIRRSSDQIVQDKITKLEADLVKYKAKVTATEKAIADLKNPAYKMKDIKDKINELDLPLDEVMKALLGYAGDKLNIQKSDLNKENVSASLLSFGVERNLVDSYMDIISECEFARYAPGNPDATMEKIYTSASDVINELDSAIKKKK